MRKHSENSEEFVTEFLYTAERRCLSMDESMANKSLHSARRNAVELTPSMPTQEHRIRMVVLGASGVGKTQLVSRFLGRPFKEPYLPTAEDFHRTKYIIKGHTYQLDILDMAGQTVSPLMQKLTLFTGDLFLVVYSLTERSSWERAKDIVSSIEEVTRDPERTNICIERSFKTLLHSSSGTSIQCDKFENGILDRKKSHKMTTIPILVVGNKCDAPNIKVQSCEITEWLKQRGPNPTSTVDHILASAKTNYNIQDLYDRLFAMSHLPAEMSPNMHRRVPESEFFLELPRGKESHSRKGGRSESADFPKVSIRKGGTSRGEPKCRFSRDACSNSSSDGEERVVAQSPSAIAVICPHQRRPSVDTEVLLAISKVRACTPNPKTKNKKIVSSYMAAAEKLRKQINKIHISSHR